jgi:hypothetical protein
LPRKGPANRQGLFHVCLKLVVLDETKRFSHAQNYVRCGNAGFRIVVSESGKGHGVTCCAHQFFRRSWLFMIVVLSLLFIAFVFGIWMGLNFYRRVAVKGTINTGLLRRYMRTRTDSYKRPSIYE